MPIYEYRCERCEAEFEVSQRITEDPLTTHEGCGGPVKRLISRTSFNLKGSGWYSDHYGLQTKEGGKTEGHEKGESKESDGEKKAGASGTPDKADKATPGEKKETKAAPAKKPASGDKAKAGGGASTKD